jgi:alkylhydroperoxidase family enzyme
MSHDTKRAAQQAVVARVLEGEGHTSPADRRAAFDKGGLAEPLSSLIEKVALHPTRVTDDDIAAVVASDLSEDQVFELVVCAAVGQATRQYETALGALDAATGDAHAS